MLGHGKLLVLGQWLFGRIKRTFFAGAERNTLSMREIVITCADCGKQAATIAYDGQKPPRLEISSLVCKASAGQVGNESVSANLFARVGELAREDLGALHALDPDLFGFVCRRCRVAYCYEHWSDIQDTFDDGLYDDTLGTCPHGHRQMLND